MDANRSYERIARELLDEVDETDRREDEVHGDARGDELPEQLCTHEGRRAALRDAKRKLDAEREMAGDRVEVSGAVEPIVAFDLDRERYHSEKGRRGWFREGRHQLDEQRKQQARPVARSRTERLNESKRRLEEEHQVELESNAAYETYRATRATAEDDGSATRRIPTRRRRCRPGRSTRPITIRGSFARPGSLLGRGTTRRRRSPSTRSSWPRRSRSIRPTSVTSSRWSTPLSASSARSVWPRYPKRCSPIRVLAQAADGERRQSRYAGTDPTGLRVTHYPTPRVGQRAVRVHEDGALNRARRGAVSKTDGHDRAGVRPDEVQPTVRPVPTKRPVSRALRVAISSRDPQPPETPQPPDRRRRALIRPQGGQCRPVRQNPTPARTAAAYRVQPFIRRPPARAFVPAYREPTIASRGGDHAGRGRRRHRNATRLSEYRCRLTGLRHFRYGSRIRWC